MKFIEKYLKASRTNEMQSLESRSMLSVDLSVQGVTCDAKFDWLVAGDKFNVSAVIVNDAASDTMASGKVDLDVYAVDPESGESTWIGGKESVALKLSPGKSAKFTVPVTLDFGYDSGVQQIRFGVSPSASDPSGNIDEDDNSDNDDAMATDKDGDEVAFEFAYRIGSYDSTPDDSTDDARTDRKGVKMLGTLDDDVLDGNGQPVLDNNGDPVTVTKKFSFSLSGPGYCEGFGDETQTTIVFQGTTNASAFVATVSGGLKGSPDLNQYDVEDDDGITITVNGSLKSFKATGFNFISTEISVDGTLGDFTCNQFDGSSLECDALGAFTATDFMNDGSIDLGDAGAIGLKLTVKNGISGSSVDSDGKILAISAGDVEDSDFGASGIGTIDSKDGFDADITTTGTNRDLDDDDGQTPISEFDGIDLTAVALAKLTVKNNASGNWDFDGGVGSIAIGGVDASDTGSLFVSVMGNLKSFTASKDIVGDLDGPDGVEYGLHMYALWMNSVTMSKSLRQSEVKAGVAFPLEGAPMFIPADEGLAPVKGAMIGTLASFSVKGDIEDTLVRASFNPFEGDVEQGTWQKSNIQKITIGGNLLGSTEFLAVTMPAKVSAKVGGTVRSLFTADDAVHNQAFELNEDGNPWFRRSH